MPFNDGYREHIVARDAATIASNIECDVDLSEPLPATWKTME